MIDVENPDFKNVPSSDARPRFPYRPADASSQPVVSIITPYYDTDEVFLDTARSLFNQSFQEWEWVIVNDGSTEPSSLARLAAVGTGDSRVKVVNQPNRGPSAARNAAFRESTGRYICLLDSDDLLEPTYIEECVWFLESQPEFGFCNSWSVNFGSEEFLWNTGFERGKDHLKANSGPPLSVIRRAAFEASGGFDESIRFGHEDWDFWLALAKAGYWGYTLPEYLEWYRKRKGSRFHQVMGTASMHGEFEAFIAKKYNGLGAKFPSPRLKESEPYEVINTDLPFRNRIAKADGERRILFIVPWMVTGGADKVNLDWAQGLIEQGWRVSICATLQARHTWHHEFARLTPDIFILRDFLRIADFPRFLVYLIRSRQIDTVLVTGSTIGYQLLPFLRSSCPGVAFVDLCHVEEPHWLSGGHPRFGVGYQDTLDLNVVTTGHLRDTMTGRGADPARIEVCHFGIDLPLMDKVAERSQRAETAPGLDDDVPVIVYAGRICEQKRPQLFADILREITRRDMAFRALVVGDGELRPQLEKSIRKYGLESSVHMLGTVDHRRWLEVLAAADIFLLPSQYEGISVALLEAMALKVVPIVAAVGDQSEVVTAECGFLIPHGGDEVKAYAEAISFLAMHPERRAVMASAGRERIRRDFSHEQTLGRLLQALERANALARTHPRQPVTPGLARELATLTVEYTRLNGLADSLWSQWTQTASGVIAPSHALSPGSFGRLLALIGGTKIGAIILRSRLVRAAGKWLLRRLESMQQRQSRTGDK